MNRDIFASCLNGREYMNEIQDGEACAARENNFLVVFGASDDLLELRGAFYDEFDVFNGGEVFIYNGKPLVNKCTETDCPYFLDIKKQAKNKIEAIWDKDGYSWFIESNMPYAPFDIMEDGEKYCRGIVIDLKSVKD